MLGVFAIKAVDLLPMAIISFPYNEGSSEMIRTDKNKDSNILMDYSTLNL